MSVYIKSWTPVFPLDDFGLMNLSMTFVGPRRSGKTHVVGHFILRYFNNAYDIIIVVSIESGLVEYRKYVKDQRFFMTSYSPELIDIIIKHNSKATKKSEVKNTLIIFDDTASRSQVKNNEILDLYMKGRHWNISVLYCSQTPVLCDTNWRENSDLIFLYKPRTAKTRQYIVENLISGSAEFDGDDELTPREERRLYTRILSTITKQKFRILVIDNVQGGLWKYTAPGIFNPKKFKLRGKKIKKVEIEEILENENENEKKTPEN